MISAANKAFINYRSPEYNEELKSFIERTSESFKEDPDAKRKAIEGLILSGIADQDGHIKERIVSWE